MKSLTSKCPVLKNAPVVLSHKQQYVKKMGVKILRLYYFNKFCVASLEDIEQKLWNKFKIKRWQHKLAWIQALTAGEKGITHCSVTNPDFLTPGVTSSINQYTKAGSLHCFSGGFFP